MIIDTRYVTYTISIPDKKEHENVYRLLTETEHDFPNLIKVISKDEDLRTISFYAPHYFAVTIDQLLEDEGIKLGERFVSEIKMGI